MGYVKKRLEIDNDEIGDCKEKAGDLRIKYLEI